MSWVWSCKSWIDHTSHSTVRPKVVDGIHQALGKQDILLCPAKFDEAFLLEGIFGGWTWRQWGEPESDGMFLPGPEVQKGNSSDMCCDGFCMFLCIVDEIWVDLHHIIVITYIDIYNYIIISYSIYPRNTYYSQVKRQRRGEKRQRSYKKTNSGEIVSGG